MNVLSHGPPGSGKSYAISSYPGKVLLIQTEPGIVSALEAEGAKERIQVVRANTWKQLDVLRAGVDKWLRTEHKDVEFDLLAFDSVTEMAAIAREHVLEQFPSKARKNLELRIPTLEQWGMIVEMTYQLLRSIVHYEGADLYATAQVDLRDIASDDGDDLTRTRFFPAMPGRIRMLCTHLFDKVLWTEALPRGQKIEYVATTRPSRLYDAKVRGGESKRRVPLNLAQVFGKS